MSSQVDRLQALLHRVQQNRVKPRPDGGAGEQLGARERGAPSGRPVPMAGAPMASAPMASAPMAAAAPPQRELARPDSRPAPGPEPRAASRVEQRDPHEVPTSVVPRPRVDAPPPAATLSAASRGEPLIIDPPVPQPSKPVVQVVSKHPPSVALSFGELLRRSLSLRPR
jgi:hypothetical protein